MDTRRKLASREEYVPRTKLGEKLMEIRRRIEESGIPLLSADEIEAEVKLRRGDQD